MLALQKALKNYLKSCGLTKVVIGASGGIDSAVNASLFVSVLGPENVLLVNMPSRYNSDLTKGLAADLSRNLACWQTVVPIEDSVNLTYTQINGRKINRADLLENTLYLSGFHMENVQARDRSSRILAALSSAFGGVFTCNANKAEMMVGYSTLYGDHGGFMAPLGDLWKSEVYELGRLLDLHHFKRQVIPEGIYDIVPSAELSDKQDVTLGQGDPMTYWYHDKLFSYWIENWNRKGPEGVLEALLEDRLEDELGLEKSWKEAFVSGKEELVTDLERWWKLFRGMGVAKRIQSPPVVCISKRSFGFDYRESLIPVYFSQNYVKLRAIVLSEK
jgi:NAD+ synthase (glutamine-hydrolysing)